MNLKAKIGICVLMSMGLSSCEKDKVFPVIPELSTRSFVRIDPATAVWQIDFTDGDGDIGVENQSDTANFIVDIFYRKNGNDSLLPAQNYRVPVVENIRTSAGIEGFIQFDIQGLDFFSPFRGIDSLIYSGYIIDRSGNRSNTVYTPLILVN